LQNYEFLANFFQPKKIRKIRILDLCSKVPKIAKNALFYVHLFRHFGMELKSDG